jgi:hypothetical protein
LYSCLLSNKTRLTWTGFWRLNLKSNFLLNTVIFLQFYILHKYFYVCPVSLSLCLALSLCLSVSLSLCLSASILFLFASILFLSASILFLSASILFLSASLSVSLCLSLSLSVSLCLSLCLSVSLYVVEKITAVKYHWEVNKINSSRNSINNTTTRNAIANHKSDYR